MCHETATNFKLTLDEIEEIFPSCLDFLIATEILISTGIDPNAPLTQAAMNERSANELTAARKELDGLVRDVAKALDKADAEKWEEVNRAWETYVDLATKFEAAPNVGGSIYPLIYNTAERRYVDQRLQNVRRQLKPEEL